jgi:DNA-binding response OmpR family regulator
MPARILVIEDDRDIWHSLELLLRRSGHSPRWAGDGNEGLAQFEAFEPELVVLDIGLPGLDGWTVLERIRHQSQVPVLLLTARGLESEKVRGLQGGADDYLTKPFSIDELMARVASLLRRARPAEATSPVFDDGRLRVDFREHSVLLDGAGVQLTPSEFRLLTALLRHAGQVLSNHQLLEMAWHDPSGIGPGKVKLTILSLRRKLGWTDLKASPIESVRGFGYRYRRADPEV